MVTIIYPFLSTLCLARSNHNTSMSGIQGFLMYCNKMNCLFLHAALLFQLDPKFAKGKTLLSP
jgi:hypothetical protein